LTAKGKESGSSGPNKFILISCGGPPAHPPALQPQVQSSDDSKRTEVITETLGLKPAARDVNVSKSPGAPPRQRRENCGTWSASQGVRSLGIHLWEQGLQSVAACNRQASRLNQGHFIFPHPESLTQILCAPPKGLWL
jgi:hypothetical protein